MNHKKSLSILISFLFFVTSQSVFASEEEQSEFSCYLVIDTLRCTKPPLSLKRSCSWSHWNPKSAKLTQISKSTYALSLDENIESVDFLEVEITKKRMIVKGQVLEGLKWTDKVLIKKSKNKYVKSSYANSWFKFLPKSTDDEGLYYTLSCSN